MKKQIISVNPEIVYFSADRQQLIKVTNQTSESLSNCFFCMYSTQRYEFAPICFSLAPNEQKLITVTFIGELAHKETKQFAYLKSANISRRVTLVLGASSDEKFRSPGSGTEEIYTLSSRDYKETQKSAYEKVIADKQNYIRRLERRLQEQQDSVRKHPTSDHKNNNFYLHEIANLEMTISLLNQEKDELVKQNLLMQERFDEYKRLSSQGEKHEHMNELLNQKNSLIHKQCQQIRFLQAQCEQFLGRMSEKEGLIHELEHKIRSMMSAEENHNKLNQALKEQLMRYQENSLNVSKTYECRIRELQESAIKNNEQCQKVRMLQKEVKSKEKDLQRIAKEIEQEKANRKATQDLRAQNLEIKDQLSEQNSRLTQQNEQMKKQIDELKQERVVYRSKIQGSEHSNSKVSHYLQIALESCKHENEILKSCKNEFEREISQKIRKLKSCQNRIESLQRKLSQTDEDLQGMRAERNELEQNLRALKKQNHENMIRLKQQNIQLIEKINVFERTDKQSENLAQLKTKLQEKEEQLIIADEKAHQAESENDKLIKKIGKVKKQTKKEIRSLQDDTLEELRRVKAEKNRLLRKVVELEESMTSETHDMSRAKTKTHYDTPHSNAINVKNRCPRSQAEKRVFGIKNQRRELQESNNSSRHDIDLEGLYSELGELREFKTYVNNELNKLAQNTGLTATMKENFGQTENMGSIFDLIKLFKELQNSLALKQNNAGMQQSNKTMKARIRQLESINEQLRQSRELERVQVPKQENQTLLGFLREEMKTQYSKYYDSLKFAEDKFNLLKKKIYEEYRSRIIGVLSKRKQEDQTIFRVETVLERFIEGLSNLSHKQAVLAKEIKMKVSARKEVEALRTKNKQLIQIIEAKRGYCTRQPISVYMCQNENQWFDNIKLEAEAVTLKAEMSKLKQEMDLSKTNASYLEDELKTSLIDLKAKEDQVLKLKTDIIKISNENERQAAKREEELDRLKAKYTQNDSFDKKKRAVTPKDQQFNAIKQDLQRKKDIIKGLKQREKLLENLLQETKRSEQTLRSRQRRQYVGEQRMQNSLRDLTETNRQLRLENSKLRQEFDKLEEDLKHKTAALKRLRSQGEESRIRALKTDEHQKQRQTEEIRQLREELRKTKDTLDKLKKKRDRDIHELESQMKKIQNQSLIEKRSLESVIRGVIDTLRRIYTSLDIISRKKNIAIERCPDFQELQSHPSEIDSLKIYETFQKIIDNLKN